MGTNHLRDDLPKASRLQINDSTLEISDHIKAATSEILNTEHLLSPSFLIGRQILREKIETGHLEGINSLIFDILTYRPEFLEERYQNQKNNEYFLINMREKLKDYSNYYTRVLAEIERHAKLNGNLSAADNVAWFSLKTKDSVEQTGLLNYKIYTTIPVASYDYITTLYQLGDTLNNLHNITGDKISLKVPRTMLGFVAHSDSLVIYFKHPENKEVIEQILNEWKIKNHIVEEARNLGRMKFAKDGATTSFSDLIANNIEKWIVTYYGKYSPDILATSAIEHAIKQSQVPPKE